MMLDNVFMTVLDMSRAAGLAILAVFLVRLCLKKAPKWISCALWAVVLLRLLCPFSLEAPVSIMPEMTPVAEYYTLADKDISFAAAAKAAGGALGDAIEGGIKAQRFITGTAEDGSAVYAVSSWWEVWILFGKYLWLAGVVAMLVYGAVSYMRLRHRLREAIPVENNICIADSIETPFVLGVVRPKIYLPSSLKEGEREYVILHEQHHIRRLDPAVKLLAWLALCIHWFDPLVWLAFAAAERDMEMSCDEAVVKKLGTDIRAEYSASLLRFATGRRMAVGMPLAFGEGNIRGRIRNLAGWKKPALWVVAAAIVLCAAAAFCLLTNPAGAGGRLAEDSMRSTWDSAGPDFSVSYETNIGAQVKSGELYAELWQNGEQVQSGRLSFADDVSELGVRMAVRRKDGRAADVDVQLSADAAELCTSFALPEHSGGIGWSATAYDEGEVVSLAPESGRILAALAIDFGSGVRSMSCQNLEMEPERLEKAAYLLVIRAELSDKELPESVEADAAYIS